MIRENMDRVRERILSACARSSRNPNEITLVAVTKTHPAKVIKEAFEAGVKDIGENRVQEALRKFLELATTNYQLPTINWHLLGHLQTNKVKPAVKMFDLIQSLDSLKLALEIEKEAGKIDKIQDCLIEVKTSFEETKSGAAEENLLPLLEGIKGLKHVRIKGLMTIAPYGTDARPYFRKLYALREKLGAITFPESIGFGILSMGMTGDFETAIEEGSTMVRIGRAIFGERV
ncbi:MAG TPA: YggS family pyridoxal phosphate-dependent enzyme [bacterium]|nr:YggS family pyridoxal phosphate-dependent enzyme [bacterium]